MSQRITRTPEREQTPEEKRKLHAKSLKQGDVALFSYESNDNTVISSAGSIVKNFSESDVKNKLWKFNVQRINLPIGGLSSIIKMINDSDELNLQTNYPILKKALDFRIIEKSEVTSKLSLLKNKFVKLKKHLYSDSGSGFDEDVIEILKDYCGAMKKDMYLSSLFYSQALDFEPTGRQIDILANADNRVTMLEDLINTNKYPRSLFITGYNKVIDRDNYFSFIAEVINLVKKIKYDAGSYHWTDKNLYDKFGTMNGFKLHGKNINNIDQMYIGYENIKKYSYK